MKCENCNNDLTFWMAFKQPTPFRFKCSRCKTKYKVSTPYMMAIFVAVVVLFAGLALGFLTGTETLGITFAIPFVALMIGVWLLLELWIYKYISRKGTFKRLGITKPSPAGDRPKVSPEE
jgi:hypothetical protein